MKLHSVNLTKVVADTAVKPPKRRTANDIVDGIHSWKRGFEVEIPWHRFANDTHLKDFIRNNLCLVLTVEMKYLHWNPFTLH